MSGVIGLVVLFFFFAVIALGFVKERPLGAVVSSLSAIFFFVALVGFVAPEKFGFGRVPSSAEDFTERLKDGQTYELIASDKNGGDYVLFVKQVGTSDYRTARVFIAAPPPKYFTLVDGKPIATTLLIGATK